MPTIPLYSHTESADAWRQVMSPGGYEWWHFDAEDAQNDRQIFATFFEGDPFHPEYLRRYFRYLRRPTRVPPPVPGEFIFVSLAVYHRGKIERRFAQRFDRNEFAARSDRPAVRIGPHSFSVENGMIHVNVGDELNFQSRLNIAAGERDLFSAQRPGEHRWILANPLCDVSGTISSTPFTGRGYHDHQFGTGPFGIGLKRWLRGRMLTDRGCIAFHFAQSEDWRENDEVNVVEVDAAGSRGIDVEHVRCEWPKDASAPPVKIEFENVLSLENPLVIDVMGGTTRVIYQSRHRDQKGSALCEIIYPARGRL